MIQTVGIVSKPKKENITTVVPPLLEWLKSRGLKFCYDHETAECLAPGGPEVPREEMPGKVDLILMLGGDGTLLATARTLGDRDVPILPVNLGGMGFLTSVTLDELYSILDLVLAGKHRVSERILLWAEVLREGKVAHSHLALNDAVLNKAALARITDFDLYLDEGYACSYKGDGLIIATPTGSTAYALAAGGPILPPELKNILLIAIAPHLSLDRAIVLAQGATVEVFVRMEHQAVLTADGHVEMALHDGDRVCVRMSEHLTRFVRVQPTTYFYKSLMARMAQNPSADKSK